jgi:hypothetical protein
MHTYTELPVYGTYTCLYLRLGRIMLVFQCEDRKSYAPPIEMGRAKMHSAAEHLMGDQRHRSLCASANQSYLPYIKKILHSQQTPLGCVGLQVFGRQLLHTCMAACTPNPSRIAPWVRLCLAGLMHDDVVSRFIYFYFASRWSSHVSRSSPGPWSYSSCSVRGQYAIPLRGYQVDVGQRGL